jgi:hypothetical protein
MSYLRALKAQYHAPKPHEEYQRQLEAAGKFVTYWQQADEADRKQILELFDSIENKTSIAIELVKEPA